MIIKNLKSNTDEWLAHRRLHNNASEASIMMSASKNVTRNELLHMKATGLDREFSDWFQKNILDKGHEVEAKARVIAEKIIGEELYPIPATDDDGWLAASYDGMTMLETVNWECKQWNKEKAADVEAGKVPECDYWQVQHQLAINEDSETLYMVTDGTEENTVSVWVKPDHEAIKKLKAGWRQFEKDLAECVPTEKAAEVAGDKPDSLPALNIAVEGAVTTSNLPVFKERALAMIAGVKTDLQTDKDFLDAAELVKAFKAGEEELESAKKRALSQTASIEELFRTVNDVKEKMRSKRLEVSKLIEAQKEKRKTEVLVGAKERLQAFISDIDVRQYLPGYDADFAGVIKGKKKLDAMRSAVDDRLAQAKIDIESMASEIRGNLAQLDENAADYKFLFNDFGQICMKPAEDFAAIVKSRIADHKEAEKRRLDAEREKIRQEEEAKAKQAQAEEKPEPANPLHDAPTISYREPEGSQGADKPASMPSPNEMIKVIANHYGVSFQQATAWLASVEFRVAA